MIYALVLFIIVLAALDGGGPVALIILPMSVALLTLIAGLIGLVAGVDDSGVIVLWSLVVLAGGFALLMAGQWIGQQLTKD